MCHLEFQRARGTATDVSLKWGGGRGRGDEEEGGGGRGGRRGEGVGWCLSYVHVKVKDKYVKLLGHKTSKVPTGACWVKRGEFLEHLPFFLFCVVCFLSIAQFSLISSISRSPPTYLPPRGGIEFLNGHSGIFWRPRPLLHFSFPRRWKARSWSPCSRPAYVKGIYAITFTDGLFYWSQLLCRGSILIYLASLIAYPLKKLTRWIEGPLLMWIVFAVRENTALCYLLQSGGRLLNLPLTFGAKRKNGGKAGFACTFSYSSRVLILAGVKNSPAFSCKFPVSAIQTRMICRQDIRSCCQDLKCCRRALDW